MTGLKIIASLILISFRVPFCLALPTNPISVNYLLRIDTTDLSGYEVEIQINNAPKTFHLAMATHKEYDDRYWRFVENFRIENPTHANNYIREDSALWRITITGKDVIIKYRIHLPLDNGGQRPAWRHFLSSTGGLVGDMHSFMYIPDHENVPSKITFLLPSKWQIATALESTKDPNIFYASNAKYLSECPVMIGEIESWIFYEKNIMHKIVYWQLPDATPFDKQILVNNIKKIVHQTIMLFDTVPYKHYTFLLQDGAYGALEHPNSVTIGIPSTTFYRDTMDINKEIAHEYFHAWNLMSLYPAEYSDLNYGPQERSAGIWWSEGLSVFYADLLLRRANLSTYSSSRIIHLEKLVERYFSNPGYAIISPERSGLESNAQPGGLGDYNVSIHLQGEVLGTMLDLIIRDATNGNKSMDDVMRRVFYKYSGRKGFYGKDIERTIKEICKCDARSFFERYVHNAYLMDFNRYLKLIGKQVFITWVQAKDKNGVPAPDWQINVYRPANDTGFNILIYNPESCWAKAGLHTNDKVVSINDMPVTNTQTFRNIQRTMKIGDIITFLVNRSSVIEKITVTVTGYKVPAAQIVSLKNTTTKQQQLFTEWESTEVK